MRKRKTLRERQLCSYVECIGMTVGLIKLKMESHAVTDEELTRCVGYINESLDKMEEILGM